MTNAKLHLLLYALLGIVTAAILVGTWFFAQDYLATKSELKKIQNSQTSFESNFSEELFKDQLKVDSSFANQQELQSLQTQLEEQLKNQSAYSKIPAIYKVYKSYLAKIEQNKKVKLDVTESEKSSVGWSQLLLEEKFDELLTKITDENTKLDSAYNKYLASIPAPATSGGEGYSYQKVTTDRGTFGVYLIKMALSSVKVVTAAANSDDCSDNCPTKSLAQHISDNGGFAGMNGTYFCPPDYSECSGKTNSFDYAFYKSSSKKWLNDNALGWNETGLMTFNGHSAKFYEDTTDYDGDGVTAGISNYPSLIRDGDIVVDDDELTSFQKTTKGTRGIIGIGENNLYLALITGATVLDAASVAKNLGMKNALNIDGGGSSAMYINGGYVVGPGRSLPNAIVLTK